MWTRPLNCHPPQSHSQPEEEEGEEEEETEELGHAETYADYVPSKCKCLGQGWGGDTAKRTGLELLGPVWRCQEQVVCAGE